MANPHSKGHALVEHYIKSYQRSDRLVMAHRSSRARLPGDELVLLAEQRGGPLLPGLGDDVGDVVEKGLAVPVPIQVGAEQVGLAL
jgi:hypothetical protein